MKKHTAAQLPLTTSNAALALAFYLAGAPFADNNAPLANLYDAEILNRLGYTGNIEAAVAEAFAAGKKGHVEYSFKRSNARDLANEAYKKRQKALERDTRDAAAIIAEIRERHAGGRLALEEAIAESVCVILKRWRDELKDWELVRGFNGQRDKHKSPIVIYDGLEQTQKLFQGGTFTQFAAAVMDTREVFLQLHKKYPPQIRFRKKGNVRTIGKDHTSNPGFAVLSVGEANNDVRKQLSLPIR